MTVAEERKVALAEAQEALKVAFADLISAYGAYWPPHGRRAEDRR